MNLDNIVKIKLSSYGAELLNEKHKNFNNAMEDDEFARIDYKGGDIFEADLNYIFYIFGGFCASKVNPVPFTDLKLVR